MEINFFLDNQQISFDNQTFDLQVIVSEALKNDNADVKLESPFLEFDEERKSSDEKNFETIHSD